MITEAQNRFITYVRTKQFWQYRFREGDAMNPVYVSMKEISERFLKEPSKEIKILVEAGMLEISYRESAAGHKASLYRSLQAGGIDPSMLKAKGRPLDSLTTQMRNILQTVTLTPNAPSTLYFDTFLKLKKKYMDLFFTVDVFSGRIHTPITNFHRTHRPNILISGQETASLDVVTMQPLLLGKILKSKIGENDYSGWINSGEDIYLILQAKSKLQTRDEAKKRFFEILFSRPNNQLATMFGNANWIEWINDFKGQPFTPNPHTLEKNHSNLAWLLQSTEVEMMKKVWQNLLAENIPFLSVHDEIMVKKTDLQKAKRIFENILIHEFDYYRLSNKSAPNEMRNEETQLEQEAQKEIPINWYAQIEELENYFTSLEFPNESIKLDSCTTLTFIPKFVKNHLSFVKENINNPLFLPYLNRLQELKNQQIQYIFQSK